MATSSAAEGIPGMPSFRAVHPSWAAPPPVRTGSSEWERMRYPKGRTYSIARRKRREFPTGFPSSENATAPASANSEKSVISAPASPRVTAATGKTFAHPSLRAFSMMCRVTSGESLIGFVLAMQTTEVNPPAAAARVPVSDILFPLVSRIAQVNVHVDQAGHDPLPLRGDHLPLEPRGGFPRQELADFPVFQHQMADFIPTGRRVDHPPPLN